MSESQTRWCRHSFRCVVPHRRYVLSKDSSQKIVQLCFVTCSLFRMERVKGGPAVQILASWFQPSFHLPVSIQRPKHLLLWFLCFLQMSVLLQSLGRRGPNSERREDEGRQSKTPLTAQKKLSSKFLLASSGSIVISHLKTQRWPQKGALIVYHPLGWGCRRILQYRRWILGHPSTKGREVVVKLYAGGSRRTLFSKNLVSRNSTLCNLLLTLTGSLWYRGVLESRGLVADWVQNPVRVGSRRRWWWRNEGTQLCKHMRVKFRWTCWFQQTHCIACNCETVFTTLLWQQDCLWQLCLSNQVLTASVLPSVSETGSWVRTPDTADGRVQKKQAHHTTTEQATAERCKHC